jgi:hypothetical protein
MYLLYSDVIYVALFVFGVIVGTGDDADFIPANGADDVLHLVLAVGLLGSWWISKGSDELVGDRTATPPPAPPAP